MIMPNVLAFDIGGTKIAWGVVSSEGKILKEGSEPTPKEVADFSDSVKKIVSAHADVGAVGIGFPGQISPIGAITFSTNLPHLTGYNLREVLSDHTELPIRMDNDARCALIGEAWMGAAREKSSVVMITLGTGVGGAVMQKQRVQPATQDVSKEISRIVADPTNPFPGTTGAGTIESLIGGQSVEERFGISLKELSVDGHKKDEEALEIWKTISYYFIQSVQAIKDVYACKLIIIGGKGLHDLDLYLQDEPPCPVVVAELGENAGLIGAARLALDAYDDHVEDEKADEEWE
jgi:glucokinase